MSLTGIKPRKLYDQEAEQDNYEELHRLYGKNKKLAHGYGLATLLALANYPELLDINIDFVFDSSFNSAFARPTVATLVLPGEDRTYKVAISSEASESKAPVLLRNLTFNMQVGILAHELGHLSDFVKKSSLELLKDGALYFLPEYRSKLEKKTDRIAVRHGFGFQLLEFSEYANSLKAKFPEEEYYQSYNKIYMSPAEILRQMGRLKIYKGMV